MQNVSLGKSCNGKVFVIASKRYMILTTQSQPKRYVQHCIPAEHISATKRNSFLVFLWLEHIPEKVDGVLLRHFSHKS